MVGNDKNKFPHELLLTNRQVLSLHKSFANKSSADIKYPIIKNDTIRWIFQQITWSITKNRINIKKNVIKPLAKNVLASSGLTAAASAEHAGIRKKKYQDQEIVILYLLRIQH